MAWGGRAGRLSGHFVKSMYRRWRLPPRYNDPSGIPRAIQKQLALENLPSDVGVWDLRLQQLLTLHELNKGG